MATKSKTILAWHFLPADKCLANGDGRKVRVGQTLKVKCEPVLCERGLHASIRAIDALKYSPGPVICRVEVGGTILQEDDKIVGTSRRVLWMADATETLHRFACWCATKALKDAKVTDQRCYEAIRVKLSWLKGEATNAELDAAWSAAWSAARSAARSAAWSAARSAAGSAAGSAAWSAAWSAARSAARSAAWSAQNKRLTAMLNKLATK